MFIYAYVYVYVYVYLHVYMYMYVCIYIYMTYFKKSSYRLFLKLRLRIACAELTRLREPCAELTRSSAHHGFGACFENLTPTFRTAYATFRPSSFLLLLLLFLLLLGVGGWGCRREEIIKKSTQIKRK